MHALRINLVCKKKKKRSLRNLQEKYMFNKLQEFSRRQIGRLLPFMAILILSLSVATQLLFQELDSTMNSFNSAYLSPYYFTQRALTAKTKTLSDIEYHFLNPKCPYLAANLKSSVKNCSLHKAVVCEAFYTSMNPHRVSQHTKFFKHCSHL